MIGAEPEWDVAISKGIVKFFQLGESFVEGCDGAIHTPDESEGVDPLNPFAGECSRAGFASQQHPTIVTDRIGPIPQPGMRPGYASVSQFLNGRTQSLEVFLEGYLDPLGGRIPFEMQRVQQFDTFVGQFGVEFPPLGDLLENFPLLGNPPGQLTGTFVRLAPLFFLGDEAVSVYRTESTELLVSFLPRYDLSCFVAAPGRPQRVQLCDLVRGQSSAALGSHGDGHVPSPLGTGAFNGDATDKPRQRRIGSVVRGNVAASTVRTGVVFQLSDPHLERQVMMGEIEPQIFQESFLHRGQFRTELGFLLLDDGDVLPGTSSDVSVFAVASTLLLDPWEEDHEDMFVVVHAQMEFEGGLVGLILGGGGGGCVRRAFFRLVAGRAIGLVVSFSTSLVRNIIHSDMVFAIGNLRHTEVSQSVVGSADGGGLFLLLAGFGAALVGPFGDVVVVIVISRCLFVVLFVINVRRGGGGGRLLCGQRRLQFIGRRDTIGPRAEAGGTETLRLGRDNLGWIVVFLLVPLQFSVQPALPLGRQARLILFLPPELFLSQRNLVAGGPG
mmetsp:Transcript_39782/g.119615  ORF Transcript_39782/g.119615 Transcript_39782/m.119615 type:complete len:555 (-) Transcript_39782:1040-2704(-)